MADSEDPLAPFIARLKEPADIAPGLTNRVMAEIEQADATFAADRTMPVQWWRRRWTIQVSPLGGFAAAAGLVAVFLTSQLLRSGGPDEPQTVGVVQAEALQPTQFILVAPDAGVVTIVGDFNDWSLSATPLTQAAGDGVWWVTVPLGAGRYRYAFVVDGTVWRPDPLAPAVEDEFGRPSSVLTIGGA